MSESVVAVRFKLEGLEAYRFYSTKKSLLIGKEGPAKLPKPCSRKHAKLSLDDNEGWKITCLSKNGIFVNGRKFAQNTITSLSSSDLLQIGQNLVYFLLPNNKNTSNLVLQVVSNQFSRKERDTFKDSVLRWGLTRLDKHVASLQRDAVEVEVFRKNFLSQILFFAGHGNWSSTLNNIIEDLCTKKNSEKKCISCPDPSLRSWLSLSRHSQKWASRIYTLERVNKICKNNPNIATITLGKRKPSRWWTSEMDTALVTGIYIHGFGNWQQIQNDGTLCFHKFRFHNRTDSESSDQSNEEILEWPRNVGIWARLTKVLDALENKSSPTKKEVQRTPRKPEKVKKIAQPPEAKRETQIISNPASEPQKNIFIENKSQPNLGSSNSNRAEPQEVMSGAHGSTRNASIHVLGVPYVIKTNTNQQQKRPAEMMASVRNGYSKKQKIQ